MTMLHMRKLACDLIRSHFGEFVEKVCQCLIYKGPLALPEVARLTEMNLSQIRNCLLVLVQHNCVQGYKLEHEGAAGQAPKVFTSYIAIMDIILHRMRFPKFLVIVRDEIGDEAESLLEGLLEHGRLTLEQVIQRAAARKGKGEADVEKLQKQTFAALVRSHYIERCPAAEPLVSPKPTDVPKKKGRLSKAVVKQVESEEERVLSLAAALNTERFRIPSSLEEVGETLAVSENDPLVTGKKRKQNALGLDAKTMATIDEKEVLWRPNFEQLVRKLRHQACVAQVEERLDSAAGLVVKAMLESSQSQETTSKQSNPAPLPMSVIMEGVTRIPEGRSMTMERIRGVLHRMSSESIGFLIRAGEGGGSYMINTCLAFCKLKFFSLQKLFKADHPQEPVGVVAGIRCPCVLNVILLQAHLKIQPLPIAILDRTAEFYIRCTMTRYSDIQKIIEMARRSEVENIVLQRFGRETCRIFRLLMMKGQMEQKQIAGMAMVQLKAARVLLYTLLKERYLVMQEVAKSAEHSAQKSFYLWNVNWRTVQELVLDDMCHAAANLGQRLAHELEQEKEVLELLKQIQVAKAAGAESHVTLTQHQHEQVKRIRRVASVLEASLLHLDSSILLFHDF